MRQGVDVMDTGTEGSQGALRTRMEYEGDTWG